MSRMRLAARLRQNEDYKIITRIAETHRLKHSVRAGSSHPIMRIENDAGVFAEWTITGSPSSVNKGMVERKTIKRLREAGLIP